jgi:hypothetical protein
VKEDKVIGIILVVFSGLMYYKTLEFPPAMFGTLGAGVFPQILFTLLGLAGAALIITAFLRERKKGDGEKAGKERPAGTPVWNTFKESLHYHSHVIASFFLFFCYIVLMSYFGYTIATLIFMDDHRRLSRYDLRHLFCLPQVPQGLLTGRESILGSMVDTSLRQTIIVKA